MNNALWRFLLAPREKHRKDAALTLSLFVFQFSQIILILPFLLITLHFSQIGFTDDLTFTVILLSFAVCPLPSFAVKHTPDYPVIYRRNSITVAIPV